MVFYCDGSAEPVGARQCPTAAKPPIRVIDNGPIKIQRELVPVNTKAQQQPSAFAPE